MPSKAWIIRYSSDFRVIPKDELLVNYLDHRVVSRRIVDNPMVRRNPEVHDSPAVHICQFSARPCLIPDLLHRRVLRKERIRQARVRHPARQAPLLGHRVVREDVPAVDLRRHRQTVLVHPLRRLLELQLAVRRHRGDPDEGNLAPPLPPRRRRRARVLLRRLRREELHHERSLDESRGLPQLRREGLKAHQVCAVGRQGEEGAVGRAEAIELHRASLEARETRV
mmetsp:Transcript_24293/g.57702  ORF Transcript_24293/g.57702 Transcript_24293/m.57702 type:complete len:225 (-) Transcript_24293:164-838(-)